MADDVSEVRILSEAEARNEGVAAQSMAGSLAYLRNEKVGTRHYLEASRILDTLKVTDGAVYVAKVAAENLARKVSVEIGQDKFIAIVSDIQQEALEVRNTFIEALQNQPVRLTIGGIGIIGQAIDNVANRPSNNSITPEVWGNVFGFMRETQKVFATPERNKQ